MLPRLYRLCHVLFYYCNIVLQCTVVQIVLLHNVLLCTDCANVPSSIVHRFCHVLLCTDCAMHIVLLCTDCAIYYCTQIVPCTIVHRLYHVLLYTDSAISYCTQIVPVPTESDAERIDGYQCKVCSKKFR